MSGLLTYSGRLVSREAGHPSLMDIALGLSRQPRFGGQTGRWWSVLDHSLLCDELVQAGERYVGPVLPEYRLAVLLHDAHEALTGDVPTPLKTSDFRRLQQDMDERIYSAFFRGIAHGGVVEGVIGSVDNRALRVEAGLFLPHPTDKIATLFGEPDADDIVTLDEYLKEDYAALPPLKRDQKDHPGVQEYLRRLLELM